MQIKQRLVDDGRAVRQRVYDVFTDGQYQGTLVNHGKMLLYASGWLARSRYYWWFYESYESVPPTDPKSERTVIQSKPHPVFQPEEEGKGFAFSKEDALAKLSAAFGEITG